MVCSFQLAFDNSRPGIQLIIRLSRIGFPLSTIYNSIIYCCFNRNIRELFFPCCYWRGKNTIHTELNSHIRSDTHTIGRSTHTKAGNNHKPPASDMTVVAIA